MSNHEGFPIETRKHGDSGYATMALIQCCTCPTKEWRVAKDSGVANRIFHHAGWRVGNDRRHDQCPTCVNPRKKKALAGRSTPIVLAPPAPLPPAATFSLPKKEPISPVISPEIGKELLKRIEGEPWPARVTAVYPSGRKVAIHTTGFPNSFNAKRAATSYLKATGVASPTNEVDYIVLKTNRGFDWVPMDRATASQLKQLRVKSYKPRKEKQPMPVAITPAADVPAAPVPEIRPLPDGLRKPTREQRQAIATSLDQNYDQAAQRYHKDGSDQKVAASLNVPRKWVEDLRLDLYGDFDRNEMSAQKVADLDAAIAMAKSATERLLLLAGEAEKLENDLKAARARLL